jgi:tRNA threonylcarbamoyladenosine biosynthesis protein TsaE
VNFPFKKKVMTEEETAALAVEFASLLKGGEVIVLNGELGAGKTFFVKQVLRKFGIDNVSSPTFALVNEYAGGLKFYHFDFYRINKASEMIDIGFTDYLNDESAVSFIEWGNLLSEILPGERIEINIKFNDDMSREFEFLNYE